MDWLFLLAIATPIFGGVGAFFVIAWPTIKKDRQRARARAKLKAK